MGYTKEGNAAAVLPQAALYWRLQIFTDKKPAPVLTTLRAL